MMGLQTWQRGCIRQLFKSSVRRLQEHVPPSIVKSRKSNFSSIRLTGPSKQPHNLIVEPQSQTLERELPWFLKVY